MARRKGIFGREALFLLGLMSGVVLGTAAPPASGVAPGEFLAFSLGQANRLAQKGEVHHPELMNLGGMTQLLGVVQDRASQDFILVGRHLPSEPELTFPDLITALRSRLVEGAWPLVSIDPDQDSYRTRLQQVRFVGGIEDTSLGRQLLNCDIILKRYSLGLLETLPSAPAYTDLVGQEIQAQVAGRGRSIIQAVWSPAQNLPPNQQDFHQRRIRFQETYQCRFWFYPTERSAISEDRGVVVIPEMEVAVRKEVMGEGKLSGSGKTEAADDFAARFTANLPTLAERYPTLRVLPNLYALVSVAEGLGNLPDWQGLDYLLSHYPVPRAETPKTHDLQELIGIFQEAGGQHVLVKVSGGIELKPLIQRLNGGDLEPLRQVVLKSRPAPEALCWRLPLEGWVLRVSERRQQPIPPELSPAATLPGCYITQQRVVLEPAGKVQLNHLPPFRGFPTLEATPSRLPGNPTLTRGLSLGEVYKVSGVWVDPRPTVREKGGGEIGQAVRSSRPSSTAPAYDVNLPLPKKE